MRPIRPEDLLAFKTVADVQRSPDGRQIAYTLNEIDAGRDALRTSIWIVDVAAGVAGAAAPVGAPRRFTRGPHHDGSPRWSPDGRWLAFLSDREGDRAQLFVMPAGGGEARRLTSLEEGAGPASWSPDGRRLLFAARVPKETMPKETMPKETMPDQPAPADEDARRRWGQRPRVVTHAQYRADGQGYTFDAVSQLFVVSFESVAGETATGSPADGRATVTQITAGGGECRAPAWAPDGQRIAFSRNRDSRTDYNLSDIWIAGADGQGARRLTETVGRATSPSWSPDGTMLAFYGTAAQERGFGELAAHVWTATVEPSGGALPPPRRVAPGDGRATVLLSPPLVTPTPQWAADGQAVSYVVADAGTTSLVRAGLEDAVARTIVGGERRVTSHSILSGPAAGGETIAFVATNPASPGDVYVCDGDGGDERRLTAVNDALLAEIRLPRVERRRFASPHGADAGNGRGPADRDRLAPDESAIEGWLFHPIAPDGADRPAVPAPLLVHIHGGPHSFSGNTFFFEGFYAYALAGQGWAVLALNPSGSGSYGRDFAHRIRGRWGEYDLPEQLAAVDALIAEGIVDGDRLAVAGYSYGGYMTSWVVTHSERFRAAVVGAPVTNLESFYGTSDIGPWFTPWEMGDDDVVARETYRRLSPVSYVDRVRTPTLIMHGEADDRCPIGQGEEFFAGLLAAGRVPTEMVRYPGGAHPFIVSGRPSYRVDYVRRVIEWVERHTS